MRSLAVAAAVCLFVFAAAASTLGAERKLNVLFIAVDDLRPELACYGRTQVKSPHIDALAARGVWFERAYCQLALCNPSRASLLSGRRPESLGIFDLKTFVRDGKGATDVVTLPELFKNNGYRSLSFGKIFHTTNGNHEDAKSWSERAWKPGAHGGGGGASSAGAAAEPQAAGTGVEASTRAAGAGAGVGAGEDPHADELPYGAPDVVDEALADGKIANRAIQALQENAEKPFFIAVGFHKPHLPFVAPKKYWDLYDAASFELPANANAPENAPAFASNDASEVRRYMGVPKNGPVTADEARKLIHGYHACVSYTDAQVGKLLAELDRLKLRESTVVVLFGDHGYHLGENGTWNKRTNWEMATRAPLIVSAPTIASRGVASDGLVELVDIYPTLAELAGLTPPGKLEGTSLVPLLREPSRKWKSAAFSVYQKRVPELGGLALGRAMRTERYRFIEWAGPKREKVVHELYDHDADPQERVNLAGRAENAELVERLSKQLAAGWREAVPPARAGAH